MADVRAFIFGEPLVKRRVTQTVFEPDIFDRHARLGLLQKTNDLLLLHLLTLMSIIVRVDGPLGQMDRAV